MSSGSRPVKILSKRQERRLRAERRRELLMQVPVQDHDDPSDAVMICNPVILNAEQPIHDHDAIISDEGVGLPANDSEVSDVDNYDYDFIPESSGEDESSEDEPPFNLADNLCEIYNRHPTMTHACIDDLLKCLIKAGHTELPRCSKTLLHTPVKLTIEPLGCGEFFYFGFQCQIEHLLGKNVDYIFKEDTLTLCFNIDGIPIRKSSPKTLWPILMGIMMDKMEVAPIAIYCGPNKPEDVAHYFKKFVDELKGLQDQGIIVKTKHYKVKLGAFICDAPARAFCKQTKQHGGYGACERCDVHGTYKTNKVIYTGNNHAARDDLSFRNRVDGEHHQGDSPLEKLTVDMVFDFVVEPFHTFELGLFRRVVLTWKESTVLKNRLWRPSIVNQVSSKLLEAAEYTPKEKTRKPRSLSQVKYFKGKEWEDIGNYLGPAIFKDYLDSKYYNHFLKLHAAHYMLSSKYYCKNPINISSAEALLCEFVEEAHQLYGDTFMVYNVHALLHIVDDVRRHGNPITSYSAYPFEDFLGKMKMMIRGRNRELAQVVKRLMEKQRIDPATLQHHTGKSRPIGLQKERVGTEKEGPLYNIH